MLRNLTTLLFGPKVTSRQPPQPEMTMIVRGTFDLRQGNPVTPVEGLAGALMDSVIRVTMKRRLLGAACFLLTTCVAVPAARAQCTKDTDCKGDRICDHGECVSPTPPAAVTPAAQPPAVPPATTATQEPGAGPPAPPPQVDDDRSKVEVVFGPYSLNDTYGVDVAGVGVCTTPCTLHMVPGQYRLTVTGAAQFVRTILVPAGGASVELRRVRRPFSATKFDVGLVLAGIGAVAIGIVCFSPPQPGFLSLPLALGLVGGGLGSGAAGIALLFDASPIGNDDAVVSPRHTATTHGVRLVGFGARPTARGTPVPALTFAF